MQAFKPRKTTFPHFHDRRTVKHEKFITRSRKVRQLFQFVEKIARVPDVTVLIEGETGSGKELIAEAIHRMSSHADGPFITVNSAAMPSGLVESELFGYDRGSFTGALAQGKQGKFEIARGGTLLLDEISELPLGTQTKLLRVLEEKEFYRVGGTQRIRVAVRVIAATNRSLEEAVKAGQFRDDLFYRLNVVRMTIPPLRERKEDIIPIAMYYMNKFNEKFGRRFRRISEEAELLLMSYPWKGNVRELKNVIERVVLSENAEVLEARHLSFDGPHMSRSHGGASTGFPGELPEEGIDLGAVIKDLIRQAMKKSGGNKAKAARLLGISKPTLVYRLQKFGLKTEIQLKDLGDA